MRHKQRLIAAALTAAGLTATGAILAASHREAPLIAGDPNADITDVYAFVSYDAENRARPATQRRATFIMNVIPGQNPADGPNYFNFGDDVAYRINIDNDRDGRAADVAYEFRFRTADRPVGGPGGLTSPVPYLGNPAIPPAVPLQGITSLDGPGSEGLTRRQTYSVTEIRGGRRTRLFDNLVAVPSNVGPATMPDYERLAAQGIYSGNCGDGTAGVRVFAGQRAETFYIDLGAVFDTLNLRRSPPILNGPGEDADNVNPFGSNRFARTNVNTIAIEVPISCLTSDRKPLTATGNPIIGVYASTSRRKVRVLDDDGSPQDSGPRVQVARMGNPLVNELIIETPQKDKWNAAEPEEESDFQDSYRNPVIATAFQLVFGGFGVTVPATPRTDLMSILLKYPGQPLNGDRCGRPCAELLRLNLKVDPTSPDSPKWSRLGAALGGDPAGWPNGRRPNDDVTDIAIRVVGGADFIKLRAGDGVNFLDGAPGAGGPSVTATGIARRFPFLPTPYPGR
jgi:hypothetical protein